MTIRLSGDSGRRFAYTDRKNGYLELACCTAASCDGGYFRGSTKYLSDFFLSAGPTDLYRVNASCTEVQSDGFSVLFDIDGTEKRLDVSLLLDEASFYLCAPGNATDTDMGIGIVFTREETWHKSVTDGVMLFGSESGICIASLTPFRAEIADSERIVLLTEVPGAPFYLAFEENPEAARQKAIRLAQSAAIDAHRAKIAAFFDSCTSVSGVAEFDDAVKWARFSGWMLVTDDAHPVIWTGLPSSRESRMRDTFMALPGLLLAGGRFSEARALLLSFTDLNDTENQTGIDGKLFFIRSLWAYVQYTGDTALVGTLRGTVNQILDTILAVHTDEHGFLVHGDAETWMNSRIQGNGAWTPRGDRACEIQALWYTALCIGTRMARLQGNESEAQTRAVLAHKLKKAFRKYFWSECRNALADHLSPGGHGEWLPDFRVRPNQLLVLTIPSILDGEDADFIGIRERKEILENVKRELVTPFGLFSLCPDDPLFNPGAECHTGRIWLWTAGAFVEAAVENDVAVLDHLSSALLVNQATLAMTCGCAGALPETVDSECDCTGMPELPGNWSQALSEAEFVRSVYQGIIGFRPFLAANCLEIHPHLPDWTDFWSAECRFGDGWNLSISLERTSSENVGETGIRCKLFWNAGEAPYPHPLSLLANGVPVVPGKLVHLFFPASPVKKVRRSGRSRKGRSIFATYGFCMDEFPVRQLDNDWSVAQNSPDFLEKLHANGGLSRCNGRGENAVVLESFFDSAWFAKKYITSLPMGALWSREETLFRLWAPTARSVALVLFWDGRDSISSVVLPMREHAGVWEMPLAGDQNGIYYCFRIRAHGIVRDSGDPYARACGINGSRSMVIDGSSANPNGWSTLVPPTIASPNDAIVYEMHVADITSSPSWNGDPILRRTYLGAAERGTTTKGSPTGFDHIQILGVTHVQLLPVFDFVSVDESRLEDPEYSGRTVGGLFNWGYDPGNWSVPEGSYSTNPFDGAVRIRELKTLIAAFITIGIGVILDVVYNHVPTASQHPLEICVPGYYFRLDGFSGAGDDTASERAMFRAYMIDSLCFWLTEYKLSGFRFDLMGLHDIETMNAVAAALRKIKPDVLLYGEGWDMYRGGKMIGATMCEARKLDRIGFFNDAFRCGIKGSVFSAQSGGFIHDGSHRESVKFGIVGAVYHPEVHNNLVDGTVNPNPWTEETATSVNYTEIHDNLTLYDKLVLVENGMSEAYYERLQRTAIALVLFSQGQPVLHAGMEFMRTKEIPADLLVSNPRFTDVYWTADKIRAFSHNSYNLCDRINGLDWNCCAEKRDLVDYVRRLVAIRKAHPLFRLRTAAEVVSSLHFLESEPGLPAIITTPPVPGPFAPPLLAWTIDGTSSGDSWKSVCIIVNPAPVAADFILPACTDSNRWHPVTDGDVFQEGEALLPGTVTSIAPKALYLYAEF